MKRLLSVVLCTVPFVPFAAQASCFDAPLLISRAHFPNPGSVTPYWRDIYSWTPGQPAVRLSTGAFPATERDHGSIALLPGGDLLFVHAAGGLTDPRIAQMSAQDLDGDMQGDGRVEVAAGAFDASAPALRAGRYVTTVLDTAEDGQIGMATYTSGTLSAFTLLTDDADYPDGYAFLSDDLLIHDIDGNGLSFLDLSTAAQTPANVSQSLARTPTASDAGSQIVFSALVGQTLDLFIADVLPGPALAPAVALVTTPDRTETAAQFNADGSCLAWISTPNVDVNGDPVVGPHSDVVIQDLATGTRQQMTTTRDIIEVYWH